MAVIARTVGGRRESHWLDAVLSVSMLVASVVAGNIVVSTKAGPDPFADDAKRDLETYWPGGTYLNASTYRLCFEGHYWYFRSDGARFDTRETCWK